MIARTFSAQARDQAGNVRSVYTQNFTVNVTVLTVTPVPTVTFGSTTILTEVPTPGSPSPT